MTRRFKHNRDNGYPLPRRTVLYSRKKHMKPIPEVGRRYHCFDDGKITFSRHYIVRIDEVLGHMAFKRKYPELFQKYIETAKDHYWLYSRRTDKFAITHDGENHEIGVFVRTKQGGWFSIGDYFNSGTLDVTGRLWDRIVADIDDWDLSDDDKVRIIQENSI